jgi:hypothetical protein
MDKLYASMTFASSTASASYFSQYSRLVQELETAQGEKAFGLYQDLIPLCAKWRDALTKDMERQDEESAAFLDNICLDHGDASKEFIERYTETVSRLRMSVERLKTAIASTSEMAIAAQREILCGMKGAAPAA